MQIDIEKMAVEAGCFNQPEQFKRDWPDQYADRIERQKRFAALVLEEAAKVCGIRAMNEQNLASCGIAMQCAADIRNFSHQITEGK